MTISARDEILQRIRRATRDVPQAEQPDDVAVTREYHHRDERDHAVIVEQFTEHTAEYKATVRRVGHDELVSAIGALCAEQGASRMLVPADVPASWLPDGVEFIADEGMPHKQLGDYDGVLTGCALAIAQTGTIVLNSGEYQGRRAVTLVPDYHLCVVFSDQIVGIVPEAISALSASVNREGRPLTFISGPSATSDIELNRVEGVHGPRTLHVLVVDRDSGSPGA